MIGFCYMKIHHHIDCCRWKKIWFAQFYHSGTLSLSFQTFTSRFLPVSIGENENKRTSFCCFIKGDGKCSETAEWTFQKFFQQLYD